MSREKRLKAIKEIVNKSKIASQEKLLEELGKKGYRVTQSTISRDLKQLRLVKVRNYRKEEYYSLDNRYTFSPTFSIEKLETKFKQSVISIDKAGNIIVIKTYPGEAQGVAAIIDGVNFVEILGTVAGDDTIMCVIDSENNAENILNMMKTF